MQFLDKEMPSSTDYIDHIAFNVPMDSLYKVIGHKMTNSRSNFCPVLLKIVDPDLQKLYSKGSYVDKDG